MKGAKGKGRGKGALWVLSVRFQEACGFCLKFSRLASPPKENSALLSTGITHIRIYLIYLSINISAMYDSEILVKHRLIKSET